MTRAAIQAARDAIEASHLPPDELPAIPGVTLLEAFGHSYPGAGGVVRSDFEGYVEKVALALGARRRTNRAQGGSRASWPQAGATGDGGYAWVLQQLPRDANHAPYRPRSQIVIDHGTVHDLGILGHNNPRPMKEAYRTKASRYCAAAVFEESDAAWAYAGTWATFAQTTANSGTGFKYSSTVGDKATYSVPADYPGGLVVALGLFINATQDITLGVKVDGGAQQQVRIKGTDLCDQSAANKHLSAVLRFGKGGSASSPLDFPATLTPGAHTIELQLLAVGAGSLNIDYAQIEADPLDGPVLITVDAEKTPSYANWNGWAHGPNAGSDPMNDASFDAWNAELKATSAEFPGRVVWIAADALLAKDPNLFAADQAHPNPKGHSVIAAGILAGLRRSGLLTPRLLSAMSITPAPFWEPVGQAGRAGGNGGTSFANGWVNLGGAFAPVGFYRDMSGRVHLRGAVKNGAPINSVIFVLPAGYRPSSQRLFPGLLSGGAFGYVSIDANGNVNASPGNAAGTWLDGISFGAEL